MNGGLIDPGRAFAGITFRWRWLTGFLRAVDIIQDLLNLARHMRPEEFAGEVLPDLAD